MVNTFDGTLKNYDYPSGTYITATATRSDSTSEFSACIQSTSLPRLTLSKSAIETEEDGTDATYTVRLASQSSHEATVDLIIEGDEVVTVSPETLTFTTDNWDDPQTVTVTALSDTDPEDEFTFIGHRLTIDSKQYGSEWLPVEVHDDDVLAVSLTIDGDTGADFSVSMNEGDTKTYSAVLTEEPDADVTIDVSTNSYGLRPSPSSLTFTKDNYNMAQDVTLTSRTDSDTFHEVSFVSHRVSIDGTYYDVARVRVAIQDQDVPGVIILAPPGPPVITVVTFDRELRASWTVPDEGGRNPDLFQVQWKPYRQSHFNTTLQHETAGTDYTIPSLVNGTQYLVRVRASNDGGTTWGKWSRIETGTPTPTPVPRDLKTLWPTQTSITLRWFPLTGTTGHILEYRKSGDTGAWTRVDGHFDHLPIASPVRRPVAGGGGGGAGVRD